jgi:hypothetical protein
MQKLGLWIGARELGPKNTARIAASASTRRKKGDDAC